MTSLNASGSMTALEILFENEDLLIADKSPGTIVHGRFGDQTKLLEQVRCFLAERDGQVEFLCPANRLDRNTAGPVVFAKNRDMAFQLRRLFSQCQVKKAYLARVWGELTGLLFVAADVVPGNHQRARVENVVCIRENIPSREEWFRTRAVNSGTISGTLIQPVSSDGRTSVVEVHPWTGRYHQIRAVCQALGFPIVGDVKYGRRNRLVGKRKRRDGEWSVQSLICKRLDIAVLSIAVVSRFELGNFNQEDTNVQR